MKKLYVKFKKPRTIQQFLYLFYTNKQRNQNLGSPYANKLNAGVIYSDEKCNNTYEGKIFIRRSFDDLFKLVKTYYPSTTKAIMFKHLLKFNPEIKGMKYYPFIGYCSGSRIIKYLPHNNIFVTPCLKSKYDCENTWAELCEMSGIEPTYESLRKYIKNNLKTIKYENNKFQS